ncbi:exopolyphosphatase [Boudabousia liubingyangii]|uniref:Ppx/GppA phosphatase family protein n=1 Tax=Boudabousia liubingyangii TaxID=1921764 RepID=UPI00093F0E2C|nr:exopolyphosphatase [Boudabousia liubingyangii]OKL46346.1 exopolyphosphatase [Boudabousia liubingyangii]
MSILAGIDCGTNSIRLLIAQQQEDGTLKDLVREMKVVRLGQDVDKTGRLAPEALERTFAAVEEYAQKIREYDVQKALFVATSASRDAENAADFVSGVKARLGIEPAVISGDQEAQFSFSGALSGVGSSLTGPLLVVDIGGGSTEFVRGTETAQAAISTDMGCVRVTERFLKDGRVEEAKEFINGLLDEADQVVDFSSINTLVGLAGSVTTITAYALGLEKYDPQRIDGTQLSPQDVIKACEGLRQASEEAKAQMGFMHPGRRDVIAAGALIWQLIVERLLAAREEAGQELNPVVTSEHDILDGITLAAAQLGQTPQ